MHKEAVSFFFIIDNWNDFGKLLHYLYTYKKHFLYIPLIDNSEGGVYFAGVHVKWTPRVFDNSFFYICLGLHD